jgi:pilus assembly protein CpaE
MQDLIKVVLGIRPHDLAVEVMDFLDRSGRTRVVATAEDGEELARAVRRLEPDAVLAAPDIMHAAGSPNGSAYLAIDTEESIRGLRDALRAGAVGFFVWPAERDELVGAAAGLLGGPAGRADKRAAVVAVYGPRGGVGTTFLATHLARAFGRAGKETVLVDLDLAFADVSGALGVKAGSDPAPPSLAELAPVIHELSPRRLREALWSHPQGFRVLFGPSDPELAESIDASHCRAALGALAASADVVVIHLARLLDDRTRTALDLADRILMVLSLDVMSFRCGRRAMDVLGRLGLEERCEVVVNRATRAEVGPSDVVRVFGRPPAAVVGVERGALTAQNRGRLLPARGRGMRAIGQLAERVLEMAS